MCSSFEFRVLSAGDVAAVAEVEKEVFGAEAWSCAQLTEELSGPWNIYVGVFGVCPDISADFGVPVDCAVSLAAWGDCPGPTPQIPGELSSSPSGAVLLGYGGVRVLDVAEILTLGVVSGVRRLGLGRCLLRQLLAVSWQRFVCDAQAGEPAPPLEVFLEVRASNQVALELYRGQGFQVIDRRRNYYRHPVEDALVMRGRFRGGEDGVVPLGRSFP